METNSAYLLKITNYSAGYDKNTVLSNINMQVFPKEIVSIIGANGAGKSTLLMSIFNQTHCHGGEIRFNHNGNHALHKLPTFEIANSGIAISPEGRRVFANMSVHENIMTGARNSNSTSELKTTCQFTLEAIFELFPKLRDRQSQKAGSLSGGEQQMVAISRALMRQPKLLLLDEPSLGLAPIISQEIFALFKQIKSFGISILLVEQKAIDALELSDRAYVLSGGKITLEGEAKALINNKDIQKAYLG